MKKIIAIFLAVLLSLGLSLAAVAAELTGCTVAADTVVAAAGQTVTVAVRVTDNPGFTNFAIALEYDRTALTLKSIDFPETEAALSSNLNWQDENGHTFGFAAAAAAEPVKEDGVLFTATFETAPAFAGTAAVTPVVRYIRNNEAVLSVFEQLQAVVAPGSVTAMAAGDVNGDGVVEYDDVMLAFSAFCGRTELTPQQLAVVDQNQNGTVEQTEFEAIYEIYTGG